MPPRDTSAEDTLENANDKSNVKQLYSNIRVTSSFTKEDLKQDDDVVQESSTATVGTKDEVTDWDEVFQSVVGEEAQDDVEVESADGQSEESELDSELALSGEEDSEVDEPTRPIKGLPQFQVQDKVSEKRMTTNKRKVGTHYYESANVKNKNRSKKRPVDPTQISRRLQGKGQNKKK